MVTISGQEAKIMYKAKYSYFINQLLGSSVIDLDVN